MSYIKIMHNKSIRRQTFLLAKILTLSIMLISSGVIYGQEKIRSCSEVPISDVQTTHLIFDEPIKYLDVGSPYFIADTINQIVKIRHTGKMDDMDRARYCNVTVITTSGSFYTIPLYYLEKPDVLVYRYGKDYSTCAYKGLSPQNHKLPKEKLSDICQLAYTAKANTDLSSNDDKLVLSVDGIYYREPYMVLKITVENKSVIDFEIDQVLFRLKRNRPPRKLHTYQEKLLQPVDVCTVPSKIKGMSKETFVFIFDRFTPGRKEKLSINFSEKEGGRSIFNKIRRGKLLTPSKL